MNTQASSELPVVIVDAIVSVRKAVADPTRLAGTGPRTGYITGQVEPPEVGEGTHGAPASAAAGAVGPVPTAAPGPAPA